MGIDLELFERLAELSCRFRPAGRTLMLGRQKFRYKPRKAWRFEKILAAHRPELTLEPLLQEDGYAEAAMRGLGLGEIETMDFSDYEGAGIIHDLNDPVPEALHGQFDFIFDGGTLEHVFNVPQALENVFNMLTVGGRFVSANGFNDWTFHGIYQFSPELVWTFWKRNTGCKVLDCRGLQKRRNGGKLQVPFEDPAEIGHRLRGDIPPGRMYLYYEVERTPDAALRNKVLQSDYETRWHGYGKAGETRLDMARS
ncbi:MAG: hypothetical protein RIG84_12925 [Roseovarius sp.]